MFRFAKKKLDDHSFYGASLHVCYAPEHETVTETREKLQDRRKVIAAKIRQLGNELFFFHLFVCFFMISVVDDGSFASIRTSDEFQNVLSKSMLQDMHVCSDVSLLSSSSLLIMPAGVYSAATKLLHPCLSLASLWMVPQLRFFFFISASTVLHQVVFDHASTFPLMSAVIKDSSANILTESVAVLNWWTKYCSGLYNYELPPDTSLLQQ